MNTGNEFKEINGYDGFYLVSNKGVVVSLKNGTRKILKKAIHKGYEKVALSKNGKSKSFFVHRLVADAFIGHKNGMQIDHIDGNKANNCVSNLEWVTAKENSMRAVNMQLLCGGSRNVNVLNVYQVLTAFTLNSSKKMKLVEIAKLYNTSQHTIGLICRGKNWKHLKLGANKAMVNGKSGPMPPEKILTVITLLKTMKNKDVAKAMGIGRPTVSMIKTGATYSNITKDFLS